MDQLKFEVNPKENLYFSIRLLLSIVIYLLIIMAIYSVSVATGSKTQYIVILFYALMILAFYFFSTGIMVGYLQGNGVRLTKNQFPVIFSILEEHCEKLAMDIPPVYIIQNGGVLNAFATKFIGKNYIAIYSEIFDLAYEEGMNELSFVLGHELGHVKRNHITKRLWLLPSAIIPFLGSAYSRACEYTCDNIGNLLSPEGSANGLLILASGKKIYNKVNVKEYIAYADYEKGFWKWFAEKVSSHPNLPKRLANLN